MSDHWSALRPAVRRLIARDEPGYDDARRELIWNQRLAHAREPDAIVAVSSADEVAKAVGCAREHRLHISLRGSGHSYDASALRDGGIMLDLGGLDQIEIDPDSATAWVGSGVQGGKLLDALATRELAFPVGHCSGVALSGYVLSGGFGWNSGVWGPASANVLAVEMVLADGRTIIATENDHPDLFWAARGAGAGFFAAITRYRLRLFAKPAAAFAWSASFAAASAPIIAPWLTRATDAAAAGAEVTCLVGPHRESGEPSISLHASASGDTVQQAQQKLEWFEDTPADASVIEPPQGECLAFPELTKLSSMPSGKRVACDHSWLSGSIGDALLAIHELAGVPNKSSTVNLFTLGGERKVANPPDEQRSALSVGGGNAAGIYGVWDDPADDERHLRWVRDIDAALAPLRHARYVGEAHLGSPERVAECFTPGALEHLVRLRGLYDPDGLFPQFP